MIAILLLFFGLLSYLFFTFIGKKNNATVTYFLKFMDICFLLLI